MIHTTITRNGVVFLFLLMCMDHCILLFKHLSNHMHCITKTNSTDPRQRVPLKQSSRRTMGIKTAPLAPWSSSTDRSLDLGDRRRISIEAGVVCSLSKHLQQNLEDFLRFSTLTSSSKNFLPGFPSQVVDNEGHCFTMQFLLSSCLGQLILQVYMANNEQFHCTRKGEWKVHIYCF